MKRDYSKWNYWFEFTQDRRYKIATEFLEDLTELYHNVIWEIIEMYRNGDYKEAKEEYFKIFKNATLNQIFNEEYLNYISRHSYARYTDSFLQDLWIYTTKHFGR